MANNPSYCRQKQMLLLTGSFTLFTGYLFNIPVASAIPVTMSDNIPEYNQTIFDVQFDRTPAKLVSRQTMTEVPLPPGSTASDGSGDLVFYGPECRLGIYEGGFRNRDGPIDTGPGARWEGRPLGTIYGDERLVFPENKCVNIKDLHPALPNQVSAYTLTGYCECRFYDHEGCPNEPGEGGFTAYNREDAALWNNGPDDNTLESFSCRTTNHFEEFKYCSIKISNNPTIALGRPASPIDVLKPKSYGNVDDKLFIRRAFNSLGQADCLRISEDIATRLSYYKINGCSCRFFTGMDCEVETYVYTEGNAGKTEKIYGLRQDLRSYYCLVPFGIAWVPRDDLDLEAIADKRNQETYPDTEI
ncbi:hypothetical protein TWF718_008240 [Orbilia javanica]|uniref:Uncharacterized protein n=1 Tax=Orbilia javanica TaxID=47235 RepID=A0AAN8MXG2_9PEZI